MHTYTHACIRELFRQTLLNCCSTNYDEWEDIHPPENCLRGGIVWYATFGSVRIWFRPGTETEEGKRQKFELCLTAGSNDRVAIWWEKDKETWGSIVYPLRLG